MKKKKTAQPPKWATRFLTLYCRPELLEDLQGDLNEFFERNLQARGAFLARLIYVIDVLKFFRPYTVRRPSLVNPLNRKIMFASYFKTSGRVIMRNKLFSGINIIGMAVSMSVGLLVIAFVSDLFSFDHTLNNRDRIYRVVSTLVPAGSPPVKLASTSWKAGMLLPREIPGIESIVILRRGFSGDAKIGESTVPVSGLYANEGFFDVFSFPLVKGVAATALKQPRSLVLTQTTATKLFGLADPMGKVIKVDTVNYTVTGILADIPKLSHIQFEMLVSLSSIDVTAPASSNDGNYLDWTNIFSNYVYVLLSKKTDQATLTTALNSLNQRENAASGSHNKILLSPQPLKAIPVGTPLGNELGFVMFRVAVLTLAGLALIIILSACFNYTNLSIARSLRRSREVGIRKVIGAKRIQVIGQFIAESVIISLISLCFAFFIFLLLRGQFLSFFPDLQRTLSLELSPRLGIAFILLAVVVGVVAGLLPALFYSKINAVQVLKDASSLKVFRHLSLRKAFVVIQYTFSLIFITAAVIGYTQYEGFIRLDLGFTTTNILNIDMQGNKDDVFVKELSAIPSVRGISRSLIVSSLGSLWGTDIKYRNPLDSAGVDLNYIDEHYLPLHKYTFLAGRNFTPKPKDAPETETIVNQQVLKRFDIGHNNPEKAIGEVVTIDNKRLTIVGVLKDFHYGTVESKIDPTAFRYSAQPGRYVNVKVDPANIPATITGIETIWKQLDKVHPLDAKFYDDQIEQAYRAYSVMVKVIGLFALLAICISSLGLFGMVIYTMEKRVKEISIRRVLGAGNGTLVYLLSKGFLFLLLISALIALPLTWLFFDKVVLTKISYHQPIQFRDIFIGLFFIAAIAFIMIGTQTLKIVRTNPARVLKNE
ncbi:ABC transporter permease [Puia dinghuensis]|uniref:ABC transporter permease n=1 Tax=Puia dinghuensis TaxID=1792502 RepID=A0A8J2UC40_9BACT|nr:ABC transporter permease [Puia dinghuensis]GGA94867.1 ABC transporter permease [Puia dinghuensis]